MGESKIWVLWGARVGDNAQALELARCVGGNVTVHHLGFTKMHNLPNWMLGATVKHLDMTSRVLLVPPWPDLVIATGKRTAPVSAWIKQQSGGRAILVQLGRPRMALRQFDLVISTPQYGLPEQTNVSRIHLPFAKPKTVPNEELQHWAARWKELPRPLIAAAIGSGKFPLRLGNAQLDEFARALGALARRERGSVLLFPSPRSVPGSVSRVESQIAGLCWSHDGRGLGNPYHAALSLADVFAVTGDSVSMASEMIATGKPVYIYPLSSWPSIRWPADHGLGAWLAARGILSPPRDVQGFVEGLFKQELAYDLRVAESDAQKRSSATSNGHQAVLEKINLLLTASRRGIDSSSD